jgi:spore germination cell wall hydrolase CwlJ-like protein
MVHRILALAASLAVLCSGPALSMVDESCAGGQSCQDSTASDGARRTLPPHTYWIAGKTMPLADLEADRQRRCVALVAFAEARGEGHDGMLAIMFVVMNRVRAVADGTLPAPPVAKGKDVLPCDVVAQKYAFEALHAARFRKSLADIRHGHRVERLTPADPVDAQQLELAHTLAKEMMAGQLTDDTTGGATHFYCPSEQQQMRRNKPEWTEKLAATARIGKQVFYR